MANESIAFALDRMQAAVATPKVPQVVILNASLNGWSLVCGRTALEELRRAIDAALGEQQEERA